MPKVKDGYVWSQKRRGWKKLPRKAWYRIELNCLLAERKRTSGAGLAREFKDCAASLSVTTAVAL
jgi:hypothetical protein